MLITLKQTTQKTLNKVKTGKPLSEIISTVFISMYSPPEGGGKPLSEDAVIRYINQAAIQNYKKNIIKRATHAALGKPVFIANFTRNSDNDSTCNVKVNPNNMSASITITPPKKGGLHFKVQDINAILKAYDITFGFKENETKQALLDDSIYYKDIIVARRKST